LILIRKAEKKDLNQVYAIELLSFKNPYSKYLFNIFLNDPSILFLVCLNNEETIGYAISSLKNIKGHIISLAVHPKFRRKGIGSALLKEILTLMKKEGISIVELEVNENNVSGINFYKKHGFKFLKKIKKYYEDGSNAFLFYKNLDGE
jgi:ribosomal-protein-alanine N-acetyltransferase